MVCGFASGGAGADGNSTSRTAMVFGSDGGTKVRVSPNTNSVISSAVTANAAGRIQASRRHGKSAARAAVLKRIS